MIRFLKKWIEIRSEIIWRALVQLGSVTNEQVAVDEDKKNSNEMSLVRFFAGILLLLTLGSVSAVLFFVSWPALILLWLILLFAPAPKVK